MKDRALSCRAEHGEMKEEMLMKSSLSLSLRTCGERDRKTGGFLVPVRFACTPCATLP